MDWYFNKIGRKSTSQNVGVIGAEWTGISKQIGGKSSSQTVSNIGAE